VAFAALRVPAGQAPLTPPRMAWISTGLQPVPCRGRPPAGGPRGEGDTAQALGCQVPT